MSEDKNFDRLEFIGEVDSKDTTVHTMEDADDLSLTEQKIARYGQDTKYRSHLAKWVMWIVPGWLVLVLIILSLCGMQLMALNAEVLITLLATTTVNVLGLAYIVLKGIFR
jgi:hypothetical protein